MKRKSKRKGVPQRRYEPGCGPAAVARAAGCSEPLAVRLLKRGMTPDAIIERCRIRREREAERRAASSGNSDGNGRAPVIGLNGHAATTGLTPSAEPFSRAQARRESAQADIRELQAGEKRGELVPVRAVNAWFAAQIVKARDRLLRLPSELRDQLGAMDGAHCENLLDTELRFILRNLTLYGKEIAAAEQTAAEAAGPPPEPEPGR